MDVLQTIRNVRRGQRIAYSMPLIIHWRLSRGIWREIPAKTKTLSHCGCLLECAAPIPVTDHVVVESVEKKRRVLARVVYRTRNQGNATTEIAVEFMDKIDFWELDFGMA